ncbi:hypothetical protein [Micromonospora endolithica]|uniref:hypothetical protein n=1 Tax=Micromonospora endolithica TaxID=230091 RepID=UPI0011AC8B1D|nr:hypothetical protein [Micromonospora endolithica]TWJ25395.1 hypothetical protein JD76_05566 [Micromonospora endolithica]
MRLPRSAAGWTIAVFGLLALLMGAVGLVWPEALLRLLGFEVPSSRAVGDHTGTFLMASSMASFNMGVYYLLATATEWRPFYRFTVWFRLVTFTVFTIAVLSDVAPDRFFGVAAWEGLGALATAAGLWWDDRRTGGSTGVVEAAPAGSGAGVGASVESAGPGTGPAGAPAPGAAR